jgi:hypothetical protein
LEKAIDLKAGFWRQKHSANHPEEAEEEIKIVLVGNPRIGLNIIWNVTWR